MAKQQNAPAVQTGWVCRLRLPEYYPTHDNPEDCIAETYYDLLDAARLLERAEAAILNPEEHDKTDLRLLRVQLGMHRQALGDSACELDKWFSQSNGEWCKPGEV